MDRVGDDHPAPAKPPVASATRWAGQLLSLGWVVHAKKSLVLYDKLPATGTAVLDDGTTYAEHVLTKEDWEVAEQLVGARMSCPVYPMLT